MDDEYQTAALRDPCFRFMHGIYASSGNTPAEIERFRRSAIAARKKSETLEDRRWRKAYIGWCDYIDRKIDQSEKAYAETPARRKRWEENESKRNAKIADLLSKSPPR